MRYLTFICLLALTLSPIMAEAKTFNADTFKLENGLQVVVIENHRAPVVTHMVWYKFGRADEKPGESGIAHFLEHLMFKGTPTVPDGQLSSTVRKLGGNDNAFTSQDFTAYYQNVPRQHLEKVMMMEADRMKNLNLKEDEVASERQVIIEERRQRIDNQPQAKFQEQMLATLFINHPYATPVIGWLHEMKELTQEQALSYYSTWYTPNNAVLVVSGDVTAAELKPLVEKYYGPIAPQPIEERIRPRAAPALAQHRLTMEDPRVGPPVIMKTYRAPRGSNSIELLSEILGGTSTARLYKKLVVDKKIAISAGAEYDPYSLNETTFSIYASPTQGTTASQLEAAIDQEVALMLEKGVTLEELESAKGRMMASFTYYLDSLQGPAMLFGRALVTGFDTDFVENREENIDKLSIDDINDAADAVFKSGNFPVSGLLMPQQKPVAEKGEKKK